jgi:hypothetical protein
MRIHFVLNHGDTPVSKLADVEIHFEEGLLAGLKLVGCSVWKAKKGELPTVLVPSRSYATGSGVRYFELLRGSQSTGLTDDTDDGRNALKRFKEYVRSNYLKIATLPDEGEVSGKAVAR